MKNAGSGSTHRFTLIEALVVIVIMGLIATLVALNVGSFFGRGGDVTEHATYTIYVEEDGVQRIVGTVISGDVVIRYPRMMHITDSDRLSLTLIPPAAPTSEPDPSGEPADEGTYYAVSEGVQFYSVMYAAAKTTGFVLSSDSAEYKEVSLTSPTEWMWVITPNAVGNQLLVVELSTPVLVQGYEGLVSRAVYSRPLQILVEKPFDWTAFLHNWQTIVAIIASIVSITAVLKLGRMAKRQKSQKADG